MGKRVKDKGQKVSEERVAYLEDIKQRGGVARVSQFLKEVKVEFKKITWPSRKQTLTTTAAVLSFTLFISFYLGLVDFILSKIVQWLVY